MSHGQRQSQQRAAPPSLAQAQIIPRVRPGSLSNSSTQDAMRGQFGRAPNVTRGLPRGVASVDIHEILNREIQSQTPDDAPNQTTYTRDLSDTAAATTAAPSASASSASVLGAFEDVEFYFDSINKYTTSSPGTGLATFLIAQSNNNQSIQNCVSLRVGSFYFPQISTPAGSPDFFFYRRVFMQVTGISSTQGVLAQGNQYYFEFEVENYNGTAVRLTPIKDTVYFRRPINSLNEIGLQFYVPHAFQSVPLPLDTFTAVLSPGSNPAVFTLVNASTATISPVGAVAAPGVALYITGLASNSAETNASVNNPFGVFATSIISDTQFSLNGVNAAAATAGSLVVTVVVPKNRFAVPMRFTLASDLQTNKITPVHV